MAKFGFIVLALIFYVKICSGFVKFGAKSIPNVKIFQGTISILKISALDAKRRTKLAPKRQLNEESNADDNDLIDSSIISDSDNLISKEIKIGTEFELGDYQSKFLTTEKTTSTPENEILRKAKDVFSGLLVADFFLVVFFLIWFIAASISKESMGNPYLIEKFQDIFQPECLRCLQ